MARMTSCCAILFAVVFLSCRKEVAAPPPQPTSTVTAFAGEPQDMKDAAVDKVIVLPLKVVPQCYSGSILGDNGAVSTASTTFGKKDPIYFSMWLQEAPAGLQVSVKMLDDKGKEVAVVPRDAGGLKIATLTIPTPPKAGKYRLEGYWGGNLVCERDVEITGK